MVRFSRRTFSMLSSPWIRVVTVVRGRFRLSAARVKLLASTTAVKTCMAWKRSIALSFEAAARENVGAAIGGKTDPCKTRHRPRRAILP